MTVDEREYGKREGNGNIDNSQKSPSVDVSNFITESNQEALEIASSDIKYCDLCGKEIEIELEQKEITNICKKCKQEHCSHNYIKKIVCHGKYYNYYVFECIYCGHKKGDDDPIEEIKSEDKPTPAQKGTTQEKPNPQKKEISKIIDSVKGLFK